MRFAFRCPKVWDLPAAEGLLWCEACGRHVHDLTVLPDLDPVAWVEAHPGACVRALADRDGNLMRKIPKRTLVSSSVVAIFSDPCAPSAHAPPSESAAGICEDEPLASADVPEESDNPWFPPSEPSRALPGEIYAVEAYVTVGLVAEPPVEISALVAAPPPVMVLVEPEPAEPEPTERRRRGLFGRKRRR